MNLNWGICRESLVRNGWVKWDSMADCSLRTVLNKSVPDLSIGSMFCRYGGAGSYYLIFNVLQNITERGEQVPCKLDRDSVVCSNDVISDKKVRLIWIRQDINRYRFFLFLIFDLEYLIRVQNSEPLHAKMNPTSCLFGSWIACAQTVILSAKPCSKNAGETSIVLRTTAHEWRIPTSCNPNQNRAALGGFFHQIKVRQPIGRQDSMRTVIQQSRRLDSFCFAWSGSKLWSIFFKYSRVKLKNQKPIAYPMVPLSCRSNLGGWYL